MQSKKTSLIILAATALTCSRALFFFFDDPEGPNLLVVAGLAAILFLLSLAAYRFVPSKKLMLAIVFQVLSVFVLYFCLR